MMRHVAALMVCTTAAWAAPDSGTSPGLFDAPLAVQRIEGPKLTAAQSFECTWYADFMVRETETDSPQRGPSTLVRQPGGGARLPCPGKHAGSDVPLDSGETVFMGRKGPFLFYEATDTPDVEPFSVWHAPDGKQVYADVMAASGGLKAMSVAGGVLHLTYVRAYAADCSLLKDGAVCWAKSMKAGHFSRAIAARPPPVAACAAPYRAGQAPVGDASVITYDVEMSLTGDGKASVLSRGVVGCAPAG